MENYQDLLARLPNDAMREFYSRGNPADKTAALQGFFAMDEKTQAGIAGFYASGGPKKMLQDHFKRSYGIPTSDDLQDWANLPFVKDFLGFAI